MLLPRIIPTLLVRDKGLVKTTKFKEDKYVGDPINAVRIFNEKEVDELIVLDIDASVQKREPDYAMIENLASECRMPFCYGGGIKNGDQAKKILGLGVEKIALSSQAVENPELIKYLAVEVGRQSVVVVLDVKKKRFSRRYEVYTHNGTQRTHLCPYSFAKTLQDHGAGEIVINSIDFDGTMKGYDLELISKLKAQLSIPLTALGGAGSYSDLVGLIAREKLIGAAAGSVFVFKGKYRAVLINYPTASEKRSIMERAREERGPF